MIIMKCPICGNDLKEEALQITEQVQFYINDLVYKSVRKYYCQNKRDGKMCKYAFLELELA